MPKIGIKNVLQTIYLDRLKIGTNNISMQHYGGLGVEPLATDADTKNISSFVVAYIVCGIVPGIGRIIIITL